MGLHLAAVVAGDVEEAGVAGVEVGLEDLHRPLGDDRPADAADELLALAAEHDASHDFYGAVARGWRHRWDRWRWGASQA